MNSPIAARAGLRVKIDVFFYGKVKRDDDGEKEKQFWGELEHKKGRREGGREEGREGS